MKYEIILNTENGYETLETGLTREEAVGKAKKYFRKAEQAPSEETYLFVRKVDTATPSEMMEEDTSAVLTVVAHWSFELGEMIREIIKA